MGLETSLAVSLTQLYHTGEMALPEIVAKMTIQPARLLGLEKGRLSVGRAADLTLFDPGRGVGGGRIPAVCLQGEKYPV